MKRATIVFVLLLLVGSAQAQFRLGIKGGLNANKIDGASFRENFEYNYLVGGFAEIDLSDRFGISPEVLFSQSSTTLANGVSEEIFNTNQAKAKLNYLSIPLLATAKLAGPLYLQAGPQYGILVSANENLLTNGKNAFKNGDFSMLGGFQLRFSKLRVSARYVVGLSNISHLSDQGKWKSEAIQVALGVAF